MKSIGKAGVGKGMISTIIGGVIGLMILFFVMAELLPQAMESGDTLNSSGVPLGNLFVGGGLIFLIIMAGILVSVVAYFWKGK